MSIQLPNLSQHATSTLTLRTNAIDNKPQFGGPTQRVSRLGDRFKLDVVCRPLGYVQAMTVVATLIQGVSQKVLCPVQQPGLKIGTPGNPVASSGSGTTLTVNQLSASYAIRAGQMFSIVHGGKRYLHMVTAAATASAGGVATLAITPMLRTAITPGDVCEFAAPQIEGFLAETTQSWSVGLASSVGLTFSVEESA